MVVKGKRKAPNEKHVYMCKGKQAKLTEFDHNRLRSTECLSETEHATPNTGVSYKENKKIIKNKTVRSSTHFSVDNVFVRDHIQSSEQFTLDRNENFQTSVCQNVSDQPTNSTESQTQSLQDIDCIYKTFQSKIADGPLYVCTCCTQTFFRHSVSMTSLVRFKRQHLMNVCLSKIKSVNNNE